MLGSQPSEQACEPPICTQSIECRIHSKEHDGLRPLVDRLVEPLKSSLRLVEGGVNRRYIEGGNVALLLSAQQEFELCHGILRPASEHIGCRQVRNAADGDAGAALEFLNGALELTHAQVSAAKVAS